MLTLHLHCALCLPSFGVIDKTTLVNDRCGFPPLFQVFIVFRIFYQIQVKLLKKVVFLNREQLDYFFQNHTLHSHTFLEVNISIRSNGLNEQV